MQAHLPGGARLDMSSRSALCLGRVAGRAAVTCSPHFHVDLSTIYDRNRRLVPGESLHARAGDLSQADSRCDGHKEKVRTQFPQAESFFLAAVRSSATSERSSLLDVHRRRARSRSQTSIPCLKKERGHACVISMKMANANQTYQKYFQIHILHKASSQDIR